MAQSAAIAWAERAAERTASVPWYISTCVIAITSASIGGIWDISWHKSIGRDTFWTAPHMLIYLCGILAGISCGYLILSSSFGHSAAAQAGSVGTWARVGLARAARRIRLRLGRHGHDYLGALRQLVARCLRPGREGPQPAARAADFRHPGHPHRNAAADHGPSQPSARHPAPQAARAHAIHLHVPAGHVVRHLSGIPAAQLHA